MGWGEGSVWGGKQAHWAGKCGRPEARTIRTTGKNGPHSMRLAAVPKNRGALCTHDTTQVGAVGAGGCQAEPGWQKTDLVIPAAARLPPAAWLLARRPASPRAAGHIKDPTGKLATNFMA